jgi:amidase
MTNDLVFRTASDLAQAIRQRQVSAVELTQAFLDQIEKHNPALNAIVLLDEDGARQRAAQADTALAQGDVWGPLHGVPVTIKDTYETAGLRTTSGHKPLAEHIPQQDATVVARLRAAGAIILGKSNTPEMAGDIQTNSPLLGRANNPWDLNRTTGGSSGGEGAALAAGLSPLGVGSDLGGSIRIPAHFCGVIGLKTTEHRVSGAGHIPELPGTPPVARHAATYGPLARSVADLRLCLSLIAGPDGRDTDVPPVPLGDAPQPPLPELKFAWTDDFGVPVSADTKAALARLADDLKGAGCQVERKNPPDFDFELAWKTFGKLTAFILGPSMPRLQRMALKLAGPLMFKDPIMPHTARALNLDMRQYVETLMQRDSLRAALERFLGHYDAWLCPVASVPAFEHCKPGPGGAPIPVDGQKLPYWEASSAYTAPFNLTGNPVVVLPLTQSQEGLPIGVQVVGPLWGEMSLLNTAEALTEITGPVRRPPGY